MHVFGGAEPSRLERLDPEFICGRNTMGVPWRSVPAFGAVPPMRTPNAEAASSPNRATDVAVIFDRMTSSLAAACATGIVVAPSVVVFPTTLEVFRFPVCGILGSSLIGVRKEAR